MVPVVTSPVFVTGWRHLSRAQLLPRLLRLSAPRHCRRRMSSYGRMAILIFEQKTHGSSDSVQTLFIVLQDRKISQVSIPLLPRPLPVRDLIDELRTWTTHLISMILPMGNGVPAAVVRYYRYLNSHLKRGRILHLYFLRNSWRSALEKRKSYCTHFQSSIMETCVLFAHDHGLCVCYRVPSLLVCCSPPRSLQQVEISVATPPRVARDIRPVDASSRGFVHLSKSKGTCPGRRKGVAAQVTRGKNLRGVHRTNLASQHIQNQKSFTGSIFSEQPPKCLYGQRTPPMKSNHAMYISQGRYQ